jgi:hypothetical protein
VTENQRRISMHSPSGPLGDANTCCNVQAVRPHPYDILSDSDLADAARKLDVATEAAQSGESGLPGAAGNSR